MKAIRKRHMLKKSRILRATRVKAVRAYRYEVNNRLNQQYIDNISHEFLSPLASIEGYAQMLQGQYISTEDRKHYASIIVDEAQQLAALSKHMLLLSHLKNHSQATAPKYYALKKQLRQVLRLFEFQLVSKEIMLKLQVNDKALIYADKVLMHQVWVNLLSNAIKHEKRGGSIEIDVQQLDQQCIVTITDQGEGVNEQQEKLFERYYRGDQAKNTSYSGNVGLGLHIVKSIVKMHGGNVTMHSNKKKGTTVTVTLKQP